MSCLFLMTSSRVRYEHDLRNFPLEVVKDELTTQTTAETLRLPPVTPSQHRSYRLWTVLVNTKETHVTPKQWRDVLCTNGS